MNRRLIGVFTFALLVAGVTSTLVYKLIASRAQTPAAKQVISANRLIVADHDLQIGALIAEGDLTETSWPGPIPDQAIRTKQELVGRGVISTIYKDEPITGKRLATRGAGAGLAATIPIGKRAVALRVNEVIGLAGFVLPGMRVDVLSAGAAPGAEAVGTRCKTILQNIEVLSAGQKIEKSADGKPESAEVVNLLVTPDQAETLNLASSETKVQLVLRNPLDTEEEPTHGSSVAMLFGVKPVQQAALAAPNPRRSTPETAALKPPTIEVFNGTKRTEQVLTSALEKRQ